MKKYSYFRTSPDSSVASISVFMWLGIGAFYSGDMECAFYFPWKSEKPKILLKL